MLTKTREINCSPSATCKTPSTAPPPPRTRGMILRHLNVRVPEDVSATNRAPFARLRRNMTCNELPFFAQSMHAIHASFSVIGGLPSVLLIAETSSILFFAQFIARNVGTRFIASVGWGGATHSPTRNRHLVLTSSYHLSSESFLASVVRSCYSIIY